MLIRRGIFMRTDLRVKHDIDARKKAAELFGKGRGFESVAKELSIPRSAVREWQQIWKAFGSGALLPMDRKQARHTCSQKAAAAKAVVGDGMSKSDAMARYGIMSLAPLAFSQVRIDRMICRKSTLRSRG